MTCRIGLPLPFYNIKCRGNKAFFFKLFDLFSTCMEAPLGYNFPHPLPSEFNVCILGYTKKVVYACFYIFF